MNKFEIVDTPRPNRIKGNALNESMLSGMDKAKGCAKWLVAQGFTVLAITVGRRNPRIEIQACHRCTMLEGTIFLHERTAAGVRRGHVCVRFDCEVRWSDTGLAS